MYSLPTRTTLAALTIASAASMEPMRPLVSTIPSASDAIGVSSPNSIIPTPMPTLFPRVVILVALCAAAAACARERDEAPPVATPSITLDRPAAAIGSPVGVTYRFEVARDAPAFQQDYTVFVHFKD